MPGSGEIYLSNVEKMPTASSWVNAFENAGVGAAFHSQGAMSADNPLHENDTLVLFGAGLGRFGNDAIESCDLTPPTEVYRALAVPKVEAVTADGSRFEVIVDFAGPSPGSTPALDQLNMRFSREFWEFFCATTNVEFTLTITDTQAGAVKTYVNPLGQAAPAVVDTRAFATCP